MSDAHEADFASWRVEFPRPEDSTAHAAVGATEDGDGGGADGSAGGGDPQGSAGGGETPPVLAPGTQADSLEVLKEKFGDEILPQKPLPAGGAAATREMTLCLTATRAADGAKKVWRVWLHNKASKSANVPACTLIGQGGQGRFVSLVEQSIEEEKKDFLGGAHASLGRHFRARQWVHDLQQSRHSHRGLAELCLVERCGKGNRQ